MHIYRSETPYSEQMNNRLYSEKENFLTLENECKSGIIYYLNDIDELENRILNSKSDEEKEQLNMQITETQKAIYNMLILITDLLPNRINRHNQLINQTTNFPILQISANTSKKELKTLEDTINNQKTEPASPPKILFLDTIMETLQAALNATGDSKDLFVPFLADEEEFCENLLNEYNRNLHLDSTEVQTLHQNVIMPTPIMNTEDRQLLQQLIELAQQDYLQEDELEIIKQLQTKFITYLSSMKNSSSEVYSFENLNLKITLAKIYNQLKSIINLTKAGSSEQKLVQTIQSDVMQLLQLEKNNLDFQLINKIEDNFNKLNLITKKLPSNFKNRINQIATPFNWKPFKKTHEKMERQLQNSLNAQINQDLNKIKSELLKLISSDTSEDESCLSSNNSDRSRSPGSHN